MPGLNKFNDKDRRRQRRQFHHNHVARDLHTDKYRQRVVEPRKADRFYEDEIESHEQE